MQSFHHGFGDVLSVLCNDLRHNWLGVLMLGTVALELYPREGSTIQFPTNDWASLFLGTAFLSFEIPQASVLTRRDHEFLPTSDCSHSIATFDCSPNFHQHKSNQNYHEITQFFLPMPFLLERVVENTASQGQQKDLLALGPAFPNHVVPNWLYG